MDPGLRSATGRIRLGELSRMTGKRILITAGPTREWMDPVRFLSNPSSGAMGIALAHVLQKKGARVTLVLGPTHLIPSKKIQTIRVVTALEMKTAVLKTCARSDAFVATAAVGDWRFAHVSPNKLKKKSEKEMMVKLVRNPDILAEVSSPLRVGFALETNHTERNALQKLRAKNLDLIIANRPESFASPSIRPLWIERSGKIKSLPLMTKKKLSLEISKWLERQWNQPK